MTNPCIEKFLELYPEKKEKKSTTHFEHVELNLSPLDRETIDGVRYYSIPNGTAKPTKMVSITSITSHFNRQIFIDWRRKVGDVKADAITKAATTRGTNLHSIVENYITNQELPEVPEPAPTLFKIIEPALQRMSKIYGVETALYSTVLGVAGTCDTIADFDEELAIIDYKTSAKPKPREWIENYFVQAMFYAMALFERTGKQVKKLVIIMACENGELVVYEERDLAKYMKLVIKYIKKFTNDKLQEYA